MNENVRYHRNPAVSETEIDGEIFLVEPATEEVFYLDSMGSSLWRLIAEPHSLAEAADVYAAAFPDIESATIQQDLLALVEDLLERGLLVTVS